MRFAGLITKATDTHSEYIIVIAFPWQQWLRERASVLRILSILSTEIIVDPKYFNIIVGGGSDRSKQIFQLNCDADRMKLHSGLRQKAKCCSSHINSC